MRRSRLRRDNPGGLSRRGDSPGAVRRSKRAARERAALRQHRGRRKRRRGPTRVRRRRDNRKGVLRPARDPTGPATHNEAERALRPLKGQQKISGSVRSPEGARNPAVLRTVLDTARKPGWTRLDTLRAPPDERIQRLEMS